MIFQKKKKSSQKRAQKKVPLSRSSGLDMFISEMKKVSRNCKSQGKDHIRISAEYWNGMIGELESIKEKLV